MADPPSYLSDVLHHHVPARTLAPSFLLFLHIPILRLKSRTVGTFSVTAPKCGTGCCSIFVAPIFVISRFYNLLVIYELWFLYVFCYNYCWFVWGFASNFTCTQEFCHKDVKDRLQVILNMIAGVAANNRNYCWCRSRLVLLTFFPE